MTDVVLYDYPKSSASYRVRIALNLAGIAYRRVTVNLLEKAHKSAEHLARNPQGLVPVLNIDGQSFSQSLAIIDYLDTTRNLGLLPAEPALRAKAQALAYCIAIDLHPVCNLSVVTHATGGKDPARTDWMRHFITPGLAAFEALLTGFRQDPYVTGNTVSLADICLIPQLYNADRWGADYASCDRIRGVQAALSKHPAFVDAAPDA
jgi:maleylacetoacetate isomerase